MTAMLSAVGRRTLEVLRILGHHATFFVEILRACPAALRRPYLVVAQIHAIGNLSLVIILGLGALRRLRSRAADVLRARHLRRVRVARPDREPVADARARAGRDRAALRRPRRHVAHRRDRADEGRRAARGDGHDGGRPDAAACSRRAFSAGVVSMPILAILFSSIGILGAYVVAVLLIGVDAGNFWSIMQSGVDVRRDIGNGIVKSIVFGFICTFVALYQGYEAERDPGGRRARHDAHGRDRLARRADDGLRSDRADVLDAVALHRTARRSTGTSMGKKSVEMLVGIFVLLGMAGLVFLALKAANLGVVQRRRHLHAEGVLRQHRRAQGARAGAQRRRDGRPRRRRSSSTRSSTRASSSWRSSATCSSRPTRRCASSRRVCSATSTSASKPGASDKMWVAGDEIKQTQSAVVLESLISQFLFSKAADAGSATASPQQHRRRREERK